MPRASATATEPLQIDVRPATNDRWDDVASILSVGDGSSCACLYWRLSSSDYGKVRGKDRRGTMRELTKKDPAPGLVAYVGDEAVGWIGLGPRQDFERLVRSRTIQQVDDVPVWSIVCFITKVGFRRRGVSAALLAGAIEYAREHGAPALEAYPVDPQGQRIDVSFAYVGTAGMFERAGFRRVVETAARSARLPRILMRLELHPGR